ncbi:MAG: hypothetical protein HYY31_05880 [Chloroflexi bacterium]|nr:hypothetical protein [Chloroflexota bacterium]
MPVARTVLGDIPPEKLGITFTHEHVTFSWGSARRDLGGRYDREALLKQICEDLGAAKRDYNVNTIVCVSGPEMGRDVDMCAEASRRTGVNIIASTGFHRQGSGTSIYFHHATVDDIEEWMTREITQGVGRNKVKVGNIKLGENAFIPTPVEEKCMRAAARASKKTGASMNIHTMFATGRPGTVASEGVRGGAASITGAPPPFAMTSATPPPGVNPGAIVVDILTSEGADPSKIKIDHAQRGEVGLLLEVLRKGAHVCFDVLARTIEREPLIVSRIGALITAGYVSQLMLSMDHIAAWVPVQPPWNKERWVQDYSYLHRELVPRLVKAGIGEKAIEQMLVINPKNFLSF